MNENESDTTQKTSAPPLPPRPGKNNTTTKSGKGPSRAIKTGMATICVLALACGGGWWAWSAHQASLTAQALESCQTAYGKATEAADTLAKALKAKDVADATAYKAADVKDAKTLDTLTKTIRTATEATKATIPTCDATDKAGHDGRTGELESLASTLADDRDGLAKATKAVSSSHTDKVVDTATALWKSSDGKVADAKTRDALKTAIDKRDVTAIGKATGTVNASIKAKADADAKQEQETQSQDTGTTDTGADAGAYVDAGATGGTTAGGADTYAYSGTSQQYVAPQQDTQQYTAPQSQAQASAPAQQQTQQATPTPQATQQATPAPQTQQQSQQQSTPPTIPDTQSFEVHEGDSHGNHGTSGGEWWW